LFCAKAEPEVTYTVSRGALNPLLTHSLARTPLHSRLCSATAAKVSRYEGTATSVDLAEFNDWLSAKRETVNKLLLCSRNPLKIPYSLPEDTGDPTRHRLLVSQL